MPAQGCFQPWVNKRHSFSNSEGVRTADGLTLSAFLIFTFLFPGLKQPWAGIGERLRRIEVREHAKQNYSMVATQSAHGRDCSRRANDLWRLRRNAYAG